MNNELDAKIKAKQIELEKAQKTVEPYQATVPLDSSEKISGPHELREAEKNYANRDRIYEELMDLKRQRSEIQNGRNNCC